MHNIAMLSLGTVRIRKKSVIINKDTYKTLRPIQTYTKAKTGPIFLDVLNV